MDAGARIEQALGYAVTNAGAAGCPPALASAIRYSVFPGGHRIRPRLCLAVAGACGDDQPGVADAAAASIELLHCASLVHDDMPCFDDAAVRRGKPSVHRSFGEPIALLAGDALIVLAFQTLALAGARAPDRLVDLLHIVGRAVGGPTGIVAGQAWECEPSVPLSDYQQAKTGSLFAAACLAGAAAAGFEAGPWGELGERLGEAYQVADDICDAAGDPESLGKPIGQDEALDRPSAVRELGLDGAIDRLEGLIGRALDSIPPCPGEAQIKAQIMKESQRFLPEELARTAA